MSFYGLLAPKGASGFGYSSTAADVTDGVSLAGQNVLITGCNSGIGHEAMRVIALRGARVIGTARTLDKAQQACAAVSGATWPLACELAEPASVESCIGALKQAGVRLDVVLCNAGVMALPELHTAHGYELQFFTNHMGHFMLVTGLLEQLTPRGRVVVLSSSAHRQAPKGGIEFDNLDGSKGYRAWTAYGQSKFANLLFAKELARRFSGSERTANAVHPGVIRTNLQRHMNPLLSVVFGTFGPLALKNVAEGAATEVYVATRPELAGVSGQYFADCNLASPRSDAEDPALARQLWDVSERIAAKMSQG
ncbi:MAG TPA: SDR family oxidoreductase [Polyangiaceae bacterium]|jgi:WW domain-containing oxidoreductase|nr:SDR family oxidoreductase [Polyangiaceae bacterium]